jgi:4-diphosphocytidyl-2-C-methyl-D-erythritol kinase
MEFVLPSYAKINWGLWILGKRKDNFHEIFTPIQKVTLCDYIYIKPSETLKVQTSNGIPVKENFVYKGLKKFEEKTGLKAKFEIFIEKHIPVGGGLGGGSSNLATVLNFVNNFFGNPLEKRELTELIGSISSDAPAFLCDGVAIATGRGEKVECIKQPKFKGIPITLFVPKGISSPTGLIYSKVQPEQYAKLEKPAEVREYIIEGNLERLLEILENPLGDIFLPLHPEVAEDIDKLYKLCYKKFFVSGSGASFYTVGSLESGCLKAIDKVKKNYKIISLVTL